MRPHPLLLLRRRAMLVIGLGVSLAGATLVAAAATAPDDLELERPRVDLSSSQAAAGPSIGPIGATEGGVGPGTALIMTIGEDQFGCTANFVWRAAGKNYVGAAGHCFLPEDKKATHGGGADYDASGVKVEACIESCDGNFDSMLLVGTLRALGRVAYARQTDASGDEQVGYDFGVVEVPPDVPLRPAMPVFGGPQGVDQQLDTAERGCHFGHGLVVGETAPTKARIGVGGGTSDGGWMGDFAAAFGDSGSAMVSCTPGVTSSTHAVGILTHLGIDFGINPKGGVQQGFVFGTTVARAIELAKEAGLTLQLVLADGTATTGGAAAAAKAAAAARVGGAGAGRTRGSAPKLAP